MTVIDKKRREELDMLNLKLISKELNELYELHCYDMKLEEDFPTLTKFKDILIHLFNEE